MKATTRPELTVVCATAVAPKPPPSIRAPSTAALIHSARVGSRAPRSSTQAISRPPAARKRVPIWKKGGKLGSAHLMAR